MPPLEERVEYPYQNIRTKNFTWGDGDKVYTLILTTPSLNFTNIYHTDSLVCAS